jgi:hypothetical protein
MNVTRIASTIVVAASLSAMPPEPGATHSLHEIDLTIGATSSWGRPGILIAWRNTFKVFEAEILVQNLGKDPGRGKVHIEIVDPEGQVLMRRPEHGGVSVALPGRGEGGLDGKLVQILGSTAANQLLDRLDRDSVPYTIRAKVETLEGDLNPRNNVSGKTYNSESRIDPGEVVQFNYLLSNRSAIANTFRIELEHAPLPPGWELSEEPGDGSFIELGPGEIRHAFVRIKRPHDDNGDRRVDVVVRIINQRLNTVSDIKEWFLAADTSPPTMNVPDELLTVSSGILHAEIVAHDRVSGVREASGVRLEYSTDGGLTFSNKVMAYADGNFIEPTRFIADVGPFAPGTEIDVAVSVSDSVGNVVRRDLGRVIVRSDS